MATKGELIEAVARFEAGMQDFRCWVEKEFADIRRVITEQGVVIAAIQHTLTTEGVKVNEGQLGFVLPRQGEPETAAEQRSQRG